MVSSIQPRGFNRVDAALYLGVSGSHFDKHRKTGMVPPPKTILSVERWDRADLDSLFDAAAVNDNQPEDNTWAHLDEA